MTGRLDRPMRLDAFMARANAAYYATHDPFADFTTAPEISQVFGELLGLWAAVTWGLLGRPRPVLLVEAGPGRGTLMADALRAVVQVAPEFHAALSLHLIETSPRLRALQAARLPGATWHEHLDTVPHAPLLLLANEFLDALPIRQFVRRGDAWTERHVGPDGFVELPSGGPGGRGETWESAAPPPLEGGGRGEGLVGGSHGPPAQEGRARILPNLPSPYADRATRLSEAARPSVAGQARQAAATTGCIAGVRQAKWISEANRNGALACRAKRAW
ncbi:MAG TPA: SAM-dependent methyltransferase [Acetobacteraceae bacterium]